MDALCEALSGCFPCFINQTPSLKINQANFKIMSLLGEGGFSYVYLVKSTSNNSLYALKKIRCPFGNHNFQMAMREVENYKEFRSPFIIKSIDSSIINEKDGSKTIYIILPYFENGSLQDIIDQNTIKNVKMDENEALRFFIGICRGLQTMHRHHVSNNINYPNTTTTRLPSSAAEPVISNQKKDKQNKNKKNININSDFQIDDDDADDLDEINPFLSSDVNSNRSIIENTELSETISFAHRDIKPANIMISRDGMPIISDLGSTARAEQNVTNRAQAISLQEISEELCTLQYRAPELLDIKIGDIISEKIDIWSLGCLLYSMLYGYSPFEREELQFGANIVLAISSGKYSFPEAPDYSEDLKELIEFCLVIDPVERPSIEDVLTKALETQRNRL